VVCPNGGCVGVNAVRPG